ncbi:MAG: penicillin-binding protein 1A [Bacillota bacterium]|nr:penicillin-binding protein 1A [Bacillota bacterium]
MAKKNKKKTPHKQRRRWPLILFLFILLGLGSIIGVLGYAASTLPPFDPTQLSGANATLLYDDQNEMFSRLHAGQNRTEVSYEKLPDNLINAVIATEDRDFYNHHGVNFKGIARALVYNVTSRDITGQGASTITQQLARNAFLELDKKFERKFKEIILAFKLESHYSKEEIMEMYLNMINFGAGSYGVQAAANTYFGEDVSELSLAECSILAGLPQSPNGYNPFEHYDRARARQKIVLNNMVTCGNISATEAEEAFNTELQFVQTQSTRKQYGYFIDSVIDETLDILGSTDKFEDPEDSIYRSGLKIYTTMNPNLQVHAEEYFANPANFPSETKNDQIVQVGMVIIDHQNGEVKSVMGGREYERQRGFNRAINAYRQPGSSIKPVTVYAPALENGFMPFTVFDDSPISYKIGNSVWQPKNYDYSYRGLITMRTAVQWSINTYAVQMLDTLGVRTGYDFGKSLGLSLVDTPGNNDLALAPLSLGGLTKGTNPLQMAGAYGAFGTGGYYIKPHFIRKIVDQNGVVIYEANVSPQKVMGEDTAWLMTSMLQTVVQAGTGTNAAVPGVPTGGKTGTSEEYNDSWFCGLTPAYSAAVWMGYDEKETMHNVYGGGYPAKLFRSMMQKAHENTPAGAFTRPSNVVEVAVCSKSGKLPSAICPADDIISEFARTANVPTGTCEIHELVSVCNESGKLAGRYCPDTKSIVGVRVSEESYDPEKLPTEECDIHTEFNMPALIKNVVKDKIPSLIPGLQKDREDKPKHNKAQD